MIKDAFMKSLQFRHACKHFDPARQVLQADLDFVLEAGRLSPSSMGLEPWHFVVVRSQPLKDALQTASFGQPQLGSASVVIVILAKKAALKPGSNYVTRLFQRNATMLEPYDWLTACHADLARHADMLTWGAAQCHIAAANMMTAAAVAGVDSCPIGGFDPAQVQQALEIDADQYAITLILPLGYRLDPTPVAHLRLPLSELVTYR